MRWLFSLLLLSRLALAQTPTLAQLKSTSANPISLGISGNSFQMTLPNAVGAGNALLLFFSFARRGVTRPVAITDTQSNSWPSTATVAINDGTDGDTESRLYVLPNANAGVTTLTIRFDSADDRTISSCTMSGCPAACVANCVATATVPYAVNDAIANSGISLGPYNQSSTVSSVSGTNFSYGVLATTNPGSATGGTVQRATIPFQATILEFYNVATTTPVDTSSSVANQLAPNLSTGTVTANFDNDLIVSYFATGGGGAGAANPTTWTPGASFTLGNGDIAWNANQGFPDASEFRVLSCPTPPCTLNPAITATGDTVNGYNGISVALKAASAGTAPAAGIRIMRMMTMTSNQPSVPPAAKDWVLQLPSQGNLLVFTTNQNSVIDLAAAGAVTDNAAAACGGSNNTWVRKTLGTDTPQIWHATGPANTCNSLKVTLHIPTTSSGSPCTVNMYDITGAAASAYDTGTTCNAAQGTDNGACGSACAGSCGQPNVTALNHQTDITPGTASGLVFAALVIGTGPMGVTTAPAGAIDDFVHYNGETDRDLICNADGMQHLYNTSSAAENWTWTLWSTWAVLGQASQSIHFLAPAAAAGGPPQRTLTGVGL